MEMSSIPKVIGLQEPEDGGDLAIEVAHSSEGYCHMCDQHTQGHELQGPHTYLWTLLPCRLMDTDKMPK